MATAPTAGKENKKRGLKSLFFVQEEETATEQPVSPKPSVSVSPASPDSLQGQIDADIQKQLMGIFDASNLPGYDYFEFRAALVNMEKVIASEPERFKATFAAVSSMITADKLIETAEFYIGKLREQFEKFSQYAESLNQQNVVSKETEAQKSDDAIAKKKEQIAKLQQEIGLLEEGKTKLLNEAVGEKAKITKVKSNFETTFNAIVNGIESDKNKIKTYLKS